MITEKTLEQAFELIDIIPVYPKTIGRKKLAQALGVTEKRIGPLIYIMSLHVPIAESRGYCWADEDARENARIILGEMKCLL